MNRLLLVALLIGLPLAGHAQSAIPLLLNYQGKVTDGTGALLGAGTPVNRVVIFRVWDHATATAAGDRLYTEQQTVTISNGEFSVLLGKGTAVGTEAKPALDTVFNGDTRFLGVTVDDGIANNTDPEITPRQQFVTTAFAFRAKVAESVATNAVTTAMIANNAVTDNQLADLSVGNTKLKTSAVDTPQLAANAVTSSKIADGTIATNNLGDNQVTKAKLASDIGVWTTDGTNAYRTTGRVGLGTNSPAALLSLGNGLSNTKLAVFDTGTPADLMGFGVNTNQFRFHVGSSAAKFSFLSQQSGGSEVFSILGTGNVGIGINSPGYTLSLGSNYDNTKLAIYESGSSAMGLGAKANQFRFHLNSSSDKFTFMSSPAASSDLLNIQGDGRMSFNGPAIVSGVGYAFYCPNLTTTGTAYIVKMYDRNQSAQFTFEEEGTANKTGGGSWTSLSDRRLKKDIVDLSGSLEKLLRLRSVTFDFKDDKNGKGRQTGFIAQELAEVFPQWVSTGPEGFLRVGFTGFEALTVQAFRELRTEKDQEIATLKAHAKALERRVAELEGREAAGNRRFDAFEQRINAMVRPLSALGTNR